MAIDANASGMAAVARRAARKPARGGASNLLCVVAAAESLPGPLAGIAAGVTVLLPWGSLLQALARPDADVLGRVRALCQPGATFELVFSHETERDVRRVAPRVDGAGLDDAHLRALAGAYGERGFEHVRIQRLDVAALRAYPTTWAKRLGHGQARAVVRLTARASAVASR